MSKIQDSSVSNLSELQATAAEEDKRKQVKVGNTTGRVLEKRNENFQKIYTEKTIQLGGKIPHQCLPQHPTDSDSLAKAVSNSDPVPKTKMCDDTNLHDYLTTTEVLPTIKSSPQDGRSRSRISPPECSNLFFSVVKISKSYQKDPQTGMSAQVVKPSAHHTKSEYQEANQVAHSPENTLRVPPTICPVVPLKGMVRTCTSRSSAAPKQESSKSAGHRQPIVSRYRRPSPMIKCNTTRKGPKVQTAPVKSSTTRPAVGFGSTTPRFQAKNVLKPKIGNAASLLDKN